MRVAIIIHRLVPIRGGAEMWTGRFIQWLSRNHHQVQLISSHPPCSRMAAHLADRVILPQRNRIDFAHHVSDFVQQTKADVVHDMGYGYNCDLFQPHMGSQIALNEAKAACHVGARRVVYGMVQALGWRQRRIAELIERQYADPARRFLAVSAKVARDIHRFHDIGLDRIDTVYNGVDVTRFRPDLRDALRCSARRRLDIKPHELAVLTVAHNHLLKGVPSLIEVTQSAAAHARGLHVLVVGGHRQRPARQHLNGNCVTYTGACEHVAPFYAAADVFVLPTYYDACSLTLLEAMACGLPVITTRCNGAGDLIDNGVNGLLYDHPHDIAALWGHLASCADAAYRERLGQAARKTVEQYPLERNFEAIEGIYHRLIHARRSAA